MKVVLDTNVLISGIFFSGLPASILRAWSDRDDLKFLACALAGGAGLIVTGDRALLRASGFRGIEIVTPREFARHHLEQ